MKTLITNLFSNFMKFLKANKFLLILVGLQTSIFLNLHIINSKRQVNYCVINSQYKDAVMSNMDSCIELYTVDRCKVDLLGQSNYIKDCKNSKMYNKFTSN